MIISGAAADVTVESPLLVMLSVVVVPNILYACAVSPLPSYRHRQSNDVVWSVRGKIIRSILCSIVCNNCAQCNAHEQT